MVVVVSFNLALPVYIMFAFSIACLDYVCIKHCLCIHNACICHTARSTTDTVMISSISLHLIQSTLPSVIFQGEILFNSWLSVFSGDGAVYNPQIPIYSFDGRNVMTDQSW